MADLDEALRRAGLLGNTAAQTVTANVAPATEIVGPHEQQYEYLLNLRVPRYTKEIYSLPDFPKEVVNKNFPDNCLFGKKAINLERLSDKDIIAKGSEAFKRMKSNFCQQDAGMLLLLAYNLKGKDRVSYVCTDEIPDECISNDDIDYTRLDDRPFSTTLDIGSNPTFRSDNFSEIANAFCFLAASTLRLFTKNAENYNRAFDGIVDGYKSFFSLEFPINNIRIGPTITSLLSTAYTRNDLMKNTLYRILWSANGTNTHKSIKNFLYDQHIKNTGMHIVHLLGSCSQVLHVTPNDLIKSMSNPRYATILTDLGDLWTNFLMSDDIHLRRNLWAYARIFDQSFFSTLQTKNCVDIVAILANVLRLKNAKDSEGIFNIVHLSKMSEEEKFLAKVYANRLISSITNMAEDTEVAPMRKL